MSIPCDTNRQVFTMILLVGMWQQNQARNLMCHASDVTEGQTGKMIFFIDKNLNFSSVSFFANLIRTHETGLDILSCDEPRGAASIGCKVNSPVYKSDGIEDHRLTVTIPNVTQDLADTYVFQAYVNHQAQSPVLCSLTVNKKPPIVGNAVVKTESTTAGWVVAGALGVILLVVIGLVVVFLQRRRFCGSVNNDESNRRPLLRRRRRREEDLHEHTRKKWFFETLTKEDETKLLESQRTKDGSFLIAVGRTNPNHFLLTVFFGGALKRFAIERENNVFVLAESGRFFRTLSKLVNYYKEHDIQIGGTVWGRLTRPFRVDPETAWYYGKFTREDEDRLLQTSVKQAGSFLVRDGITDPDDYVLAAYFEDSMKHFAIMVEEDGFKYRDTGKVFKTLEELLDFYKNNTISVGGKEYGKLSTHFDKEHLDQLFLEKFRREDDDKFLHSRKKKPGSFLVAVGSTTPNQYLIAAYFEDAVRRFPIKRERNGYILVDTGKYFRTLPELLNYYKEHEIKVGSKVWGKLTGRFRMEPEENWYFRNFTRDDERQLELSGKNGPGSFLIRDGIIDPDNYILAVCCSDGLKHFTIIEQENGFNFRDGGTVHTRLSDLVDYYKRNDIEVDGVVYCRLVKPFEM